MNGLQGSRTVVDEEQPTERTSLLRRPPADRRAGSDREGDQGPELPPIDSVVSRLQEEGLSADYSWCPDISSTTERTAFLLVTLLQLQSVAGAQTAHTDDTWEVWSREQQNAEILAQTTKHISEIWSQFVAEPRTSEELEQLLWTRFRSSGENSHAVAVVDLLAQPYGSEELVRHHVVLLSLGNTWKRGRIRSPNRSTILQRFAARYDSLASPRTLHLLDLLIYLAYVAILAHYSLLPPDRPVETDSPNFGARAILLIVYSMAQFCQSWTIFTVPFVLVLLAFASSLPWTPYQDDTSYSVLLASLSLHIIFLQLPYTPSPLHLFPADQALPVAVLIWHGVSRVFFPVLVFFLPGVLLTIFLLSTSLSDTLFQPFVLFTLNPSPMEARTAFLLLFALLFTLLLCSLLVLALVYPSVTFGPQARSRWDRYSLPIGLEARRTFVRTIVAYSTPYKFIPPLNVPELVLFRFPAIVIRSTGGKFLVEELTGLRRVAWRVFMGPFVLISAGAWLWGFSM